MPARFLDVDDYIASLAPDAQEVMRQARAAVHDAIPGVGEAISYQMPTFTLDGEAFIHLGAWRRHLGAYPVPRFDGALEAEVAPYRSTPDTVRFVYRDRVPFELLGRIAAAAAAQRRLAPAGD
jgi:uncharacterized protein YdhG (YjbR/CyaY superfamily)